MSNLEIPTNVSVNFQNREVRQQLVDDERFFFVVDVAGALTGQRQSARLPVHGETPRTGIEKRQQHCGRWKVPAAGPEKIKQKQRIE